MSCGFAITRGCSIATFSPAAYDAGTNPSLPGVQWHGTNSRIPSAGRPTRWAFLEPRIGFALDLYGNGNSMLRGGFGIYRTHDSYNDASHQSQTVIGMRTYTRFTEAFSRALQVCRISHYGMCDYVLTSNPRRSHDRRHPSFSFSRELSPRLRMRN